VVRKTILLESEVPEPESAEAPARAITGRAGHRSDTIP